MVDPPRTPADTPASAADDVTGDSVDLVGRVLRAFEARFPVADVFWEDSQRVVLSDGADAAPPVVTRRRGVQFRVVGRRRAASSWTTDLSAGGLRRALEALHSGVALPRVLPAWPSESRVPGPDGRTVARWRDWLESLADRTRSRRFRSARASGSVAIEGFRRGAASSVDHVREWNGGRVIVTLELVVDGYRRVRSLQMGDAPRDGDRELCDRTLSDLCDTARPSAGLRGVLPIVLAPGAGMGAMHELVGHALEADRMLTGASPLSGVARGSVVSHPHLTIHDRPEADWGPGGLQFDDEGQPGRDVVLIDRGRLAGVVHDRATAFVSRAEPTGNGRRSSYGSLPSPRMRNIVVEGGPDDPGALLRQVGRGLYVERVAGSVDPSTQWFELVVEAGRVVTGGVCRERVSGVRIRGRTLDALRDVRGVGNDVAVSWEPVWCEKVGPIVTGVAGPTVLMGPLEVLP